MTKALESRVCAASLTYTVERLSDPAAIRDLLSADRAYAAYAIAQLDPQHFSETEWFAATGATGQALVVHSRSGLGRATFTLGHPEALDAVLSLHPGPRFSFGSLRPEHRPIFEKYFILTRPQTMMRMSVSANTFRVIDRPALRLRARDVAAINHLYSTEGGSTSYSAHHIEGGIYYGIYENSTLVSIAGTHVASAAEGVAVVGNVYTHPLYRGRGLATTTTSATTRELLTRCPLVVLTVEAGNDSAVSIYRHLGYETQCTLHETPLIRKEPFGLLSLARRLIAGWRGRLEGKELVLR